MLTFKQFINEESIYNKTTGQLNVPDGYAIRLTNVGYKEAPDNNLNEILPERLTHTFALLSDKWEYTFNSLTGKDRKKIVNYKPQLIAITPNTLIGDMKLINKYFFSKDVKFLHEYKNKLIKLSDANLDDYELPELLIPKG
jgi:hypothetical protein